MSDAFVKKHGLLYSSDLHTVIGVDDTASIMVAWDNGSSLNVIYDVDKCIKI